MKVVQVNLYIIQITEKIIRGHVSGGIDHLTNTPVVSIDSITQDGTTYTQGVDYKLTDNGVDWSLMGTEPAIDTAYTCTYTYNKSS